MSKIREHLLCGLGQCLDPQFGRKLIIIHYSGHGTYGPERGLWFNANLHSKPSITCNLITGHKLSALRCLYQTPYLL